MKQLVIFGVEILAGRNYIVLRNYGLWPLGLYFSFAFGYAGTFACVGSFLVR